MIVWLPVKCSFTNMVIKLLHAEFLILQSAILGHCSGYPMSHPTPLQLRHQISGQFIKVSLGQSTDV